MIQDKVEFKLRVYDLVSQIPRGRVMTYGQIAVLCGSPRSARIVGGIAHFGPINMPWQRVVMKDGGLARGFSGGLDGHKSALEAENVKITDDYKIKNMENHIWTPNH